MGKVAEECVPFRAGPLPALEQALKEMGIGIEEKEKMKNGEILLPDGRRIRCRMFFSNVNFDNLCIRCTLED